MADITMCQDRECPSKVRCYRFMAETNRHRQSYADFERRKGAVKCASFWSVEEPIPEPKEKSE